MKNIITAILLLIASCSAQSAVRVSDLATTNVLAGTNTLAAVIYPRTTNGTRQVTVDNLFSNRTARGFTVITNLNGVQVFTAYITNSAATATNLITIPVSNDSGFKIRSSIGYLDPDVPIIGGFDQISTIYNDAGSLNFSGGTTNLYYNTGSGAATNGFIISGTNVIIRFYSGNAAKVRAIVEVLTVP